MMDAVKFLKELHRICSTIDCRDGCPFYIPTVDLCVIETPDSSRWKDAEQFVLAVEKWSIENPLEE